MNLKEIIENIITNQNTIETCKEIFNIKQCLYNPDYHSGSEWDFLGITEKDFNSYKKDINCLVKDVVKIAILKDLKDAATPNSYRKDIEIYNYYQMMQGLDRDLISNCIEELIKEEKIQYVCHNTIKITPTEEKRQKYIEKILKMSNEEIENL
jgi:hypothetical protein